MEEKNKLRGKKARASGQRFERKVRDDLTKKGWIVDRWTNNVEFVKETIPQKNSPYDKEIAIGKLVPAKSRFNMRNCGFPDFIAFAKIWEENDLYLGETLCHCGSQMHQTIIGVEVKSNGYLDKSEKAKCKWLLKNNILSKILIASKSKKRGEIIYKEVVSR